MLLFVAGRRIRLRHRNSLDLAVHLAGDNHFVGVQARSLALVRGMHDQSPTSFLCEVRIQAILQGTPKRRQVTP